MLSVRLGSLFSRLFLRGWTDMKSQFILVTQRHMALDLLPRFGGYPCQELEFSIVNRSERTAP